MDYAPLLAALAAVAAPIGAYMLGKRKTSGKIAVTDANTLWDEASKLRVALRDEVVKSQAEAADLRTKLAQNQSLLLATQKQLADNQKQLVDTNNELIDVKKRLIVLEGHDEKQ